MLYIDKAFKLIKHCATKQFFMSHKARKYVLNILLLSLYEK